MRSSAVVISTLRGSLADPLSERVARGGSWNNNPENAPASDLDQAVLRGMGF